MNTRGLGFQTPSGYHNGS